MKQADIQVGHEYLFICTDVEHRKDMVGTIVRVIRKRPGRAKTALYSGVIPYTAKSPMRIGLSNGRWANAAELREIETRK